MVCGSIVSGSGLRIGASSIGDLNFGGLGVFGVDAEDGGRPPDREDVEECRDWGLEVLSGASSKVSCKDGQPKGVCSIRRAYPFSI